LTDSKGRRRLVAVPPTRVLTATAVSVLALLATLGAAHAQPSSAQPVKPFAPAWGMLAGWDVFASKGCGTCHALRGAGAGIGPDLGRITTGKSFFELGAAMWNHLPKLGAKMREAGIERPTLTPPEVADLLAFLFTAQYFDEPGDVKAGEALFASKGCVQCHAVGGKGGSVGPALDALKKSDSPVLVAAAMWNHGPQMADTMKAKGIPRPAFAAREMVDLIAYLVEAAKDPGGDTAQLVPGTPGRGEKLFVERRCATCHAVSGKGGKVGPDLGRAGHDASLTGFAARMWNHGPVMWAKMKQRGIEPPTLGGQDMADILAYLYASRYFDQHASPGRGARLVQAKGCASCHSVRGQGGKLAADFATPSVVATPASLIAAMWNHSTAMEAKARKQDVAWPLLSGQELADVSAYLGSLTKPVRKSK
jgi:mono/diheme cytochrome c family protein